MKRKILLVDGYNMIAFWQETRQLFQKSELDAARNILLQKLSHMLALKGSKSSVSLMLSICQECGRPMRSSMFRWSLRARVRRQMIISSAWRQSSIPPLHQVSVATSDLNEQWTVFAQGALRVSARELEKRVAVVKGSLNQAQRVVNDQKPPMRPLDHQALRQLQEMMGDK